MTFKERMRQAVVAHAQRRAHEAQRPEARTERLRAIEGDVARQRAEHEAAQRVGLLAHLERCGLQAADATRVAAGLSPTWARARGGQMDALEVARAWWQGHKLLLLLFGAPGTGKTLAVGELLARVRLEYTHPDFGPTWCWPTTVSESAVYVLAGDLAASVFAPDAEKRRDRLQRCRLLVVDELGLEVMSGPWLSLLEQLVVRRHGAGLRTVLASNVGGKDFRARYGDRIARRVNEDGQAVSLGDATLSGRHARAEGQRWEAGVGR